MQAAVAFHITHMHYTFLTMLVVHLVVALALGYLVHFHLLMAMVFGLDHAVYLHRTMVHMSNGGFGLGGKHGHEGYGYDG